MRDTATTNMCKPVTEDKLAKDIHPISRAEMKLSREMLEKIQVSVEDLVKGLFVSANTKHLSKMSIDSISALTIDELSLALNKLKDIGNGVNSLTEIVGRILNIANRASEPAGELKPKPENGVPEDAFEVVREDKEDQQIPCCYASATREYDSIYILNDIQEYANCVPGSKTPSCPALKTNDSPSILNCNQEYANCVSDSKTPPHSATNKNDSIHTLNDNQVNANCVSDPTTSNHDESLNEQFIFDESNIKVVREIGRGNFATTHSVVLMSKEGKGTKAAWKVLKTDGKGNADIEESKKETMFLMMVGGQENIMKFIGITLNVEKGNLGFLTEMCERGSLDKLHYKFDLLEPNRLWKIVTGVFLGLMHLHLFKIIHRDIACRNILIRGDWTPKLSDFGLSVRAPSGQYVSKVDEKLPVFWVSPESLLERTFTYKSDVWAAGVMIWEILWRGKKPYIDDWEKVSKSKNLTMRDAMRHVLGGIVSKKFRLLPPPNTAPECANLLKSCLAFAPSSRADAFQVLEHFVLGDSKAKVPGGLQSIEVHGTNAMKSERSRRAKFATIFGVKHKVVDTISLRLEGRGLSELPFFTLSKMGKLKRMESLCLAENQLTSVPVEIGKLTKLMKLHLEGNQLTSIPAEIGRLTELTWLSLHQNQLTSIPAEIGKLAELRDLSLHRNQLASVPAEIGKLTELESLDLGRNQLTSIPAEIGKLTNLDELHLNQNKLSSISAEIGKLTNLRRLSLDENKLASVPTEIGNMTKLESLDLNQNQLASLPAEIGKLTELESFGLDRNQLTSVPADIGKLAKLEFVHLNQNQLTSVPEEIGMLTKLRGLELNQNQLTSVPEEIGKLRGLRALSLNQNQLTSIPAEIGCVMALSHLDLHQNHLTSVPEEIGKLTILHELQMSQNQLTSIPAEIGNLTRLACLRLDQNQLTSIPAEIGKLAGLDELHLNQNKLSLIPLEIGKLPNLRRLSLDENQLASISAEMKELTKPMIWSSDDAPALGMTSFEMKQLLTQ